MSPTSRRPHIASRDASRGLASIAARSSSTSTASPCVDEQQRADPLGQPRGQPGGEADEEVGEEAGRHVAGDEDLVPVGALGAALEVVERDAERVHLGDRIVVPGRELVDEALVRGQHLGGRAAEPRLRLGGRARR